MTKSLSTRQASLIVFVAMISSKLLSLNSIISYNLNNDAWVVFFLSFIIDFSFFLIFLYFINNINVSIFQYLKNKFGKPITIIISILIAIMFAFKTTMIMVDIYLFFVQLIYVEINRYIFVSCFVLILFFFGSRKLQSLGRTVELLMWIIFISLVLSLILSFNALNFENLLPLFNTNVLTVSKNIVMHNLWFGDFWILFFIVGNIKLEKYTSKKLVLSFILSAVVCLVFVLTFTATFGLTASMHRVCIVDITEVTPRLLNQARFNWIVYFTFPIALVLGLGIYACCASMSIECCVREKLKSKNTISTMIMIAMVLVIGILFQFTFTPFYNFVSLVFVYYNTVVQYGLPVLLLFIISIKNTTKTQKTVKKSLKITKNKLFLQK